MEYFARELSLEVTPSTETPMMRNQLMLPDSSVTAIMGLGGFMHVLVAYSFSSTLAEYVFRISTEGLDIAPEEQGAMVNESVAENINIIIGHATNELNRRGDPASLSPPVVISEGRQIHRPSSACFSELAFGTEHGELKVFFIGPAELFDQELHTVEPS